MSPIILFNAELFNWCQKNSIDFILEKPRLEFNNFNGSQTNLVISLENAEKIIEWIKANDQDFQFKKTLYGYQGYIEFINNTEINSLTLNLTSTFEILGLPYLKINDLINRKEKFGNLYHLNDIDQFVLLIMKSCIENRKNISLMVYKNVIARIMNEYPTAISDKMIELFGVDKGIEIIEDIRSHKLNYKIKYLVAYVFNALKNNMLFSFYKIVIYIAQNLHLLFLNNFSKLKLFADGK